VHKPNLLRLLGPLALIVPFIVAPFFLGEYRLSALLVILVYFVVAASFRLIATTGEMTFAHVIVMGIGGYASSLLALHYGLPFWITCPLGGLTAAGFAAATAYPLFRMKGFYFFMGSLAIGEAVRLSWHRWKVPFGGSSGLWNVPPSTIGSFTFNTTFSYYWLTLGIVAVCLSVMYGIDRSRVGKTLKAIRLQDNLAESVGINVLGYKVITYVTASFFAGIAGALLAHYLLSVSPAQFSMVIMLYCLVWVIVGGINTFWGPIVGVLTLRLLGEQLRGTLEAWMPMIYGIILIVILLALPDGLESIPGKIKEWRRVRRG